MPQSLAKIYVHVVFGTENRIPWLTEGIRPNLYSFMAGSLKTMDSQPIRIGGVSDHMHLLFGLSKTNALSKVIERVKTDSSVWIKTQEGNFGDFAWQNG
ncbi:MAG: transposase [Desulfomonilaceae bacterium]